MRLGIALLGVVLAGCVAQAPQTEPRQVAAADVAPSGRIEVAMQAQDGNLVALENRSDSWSTIYVKADAAGFHFNLNQAAKASDPAMDAWARVFPLDAPFLPSDHLYLCGPVASVAVQVYSAASDAFLYSGAVGGVSSC